MKLADFKAKAVQGLYNLSHYEAPNGAFVQVSPHGHCYFVHGGTCKDFHSFKAFKEWFESTYPAS